MLRIRELGAPPFAILQMLGVRPGGSGPESVPLPVVHGHCEGLPPELDAIVVTGDLQGRSPIPDRGDTLELAGRWVAREILNLRPDHKGLDPARTGVLLTGGFFTDPALEQQGACGNVGSVWRAFAETFRWVLGVAGNHDRFAGKAAVPEPAVLGGGKLLHGESQEADGLRVAGLGGIMGNSGRPWRTPAKNYLDQLDGLIVEEPDLLLLHEAPDGKNCCCKGNTMIREHIEATEAKLILFCGHSYWMRPMVQLEGLQVINVDSRVLILTR